MDEILPAKLVVSQRHVLRQLVAGDEEELFLCVEENRSYLREWMPWIDISKSADDVGVFVGRTVADYETGSSFRMGIEVDGKLRGVCALEEIRTMHRRCKIGYWLSRELQGQGLMTASCRALLRYAFAERNMHLVELRAARDNAKSRRVAERLGMKLDGYLREQEWLYDHFVDHAVYTLVEDEWRAAS